MAAPLEAQAEASAFAACTLDTDPRSISRARNTVRITLRAWDLTELTDSVESVVSELVTNALRHGVPGGPGATPPEAAQPVTLSLLRRPGEVVCAVFDPGCDVPTPRCADESAESGRGLHIVATLSDAWGWSTPGPFGKAVWSRFAAPAETGGSAGAPAEAGTGEWQSFARCLALLEALATGSRPIPAWAAA